MVIPGGNFVKIEGITGVSHLLHRERISDFAASDHAVTRK
ncbi:Uncharacterized protein dnm_015300 [Desulfonema magnum]|uniref:Uncharacterized protein n=1 Tax=Desulfonema magnum TaxID=45655 RepID=A0A975BGW9_9BACT|nr:Uncharacterized protein dnm_015300 [Desulfonema magnum]